MTWLRWDTEAAFSDVADDLADELGLPVAHAFGLYVACVLGFGQHKRDGLISEVKDSQLEDWARWKGRKGRFAAAFRKRCTSDGKGRDPKGVVRGWWRQDSLLRKQEKDRHRPPAHLRNGSEIPPGESGGNPQGNRKGDGVRSTEDVDETNYSNLPGRLVSKLVGEPARYAILEFLENLPVGESLETWAMTINGCLEGLGTEGQRKATVDEMAAACNDYRGAAPTKWGIPHFRSFVDRVVAKRFRPSSKRGSGSKTASQVNAAASWVAKKGTEPEPAT